ncbi:MAG: thioredoxin family protein [Armatimonadetes bacterium]|nr:thioredoxin family protein [Armatimonadota bacterium]
MRQVVLGMVVLAIGLAALPAGAAALQEELQQAQALAKEWKLDEAEQHALAAVAAAHEQGLDKLSGADLLHLGDAYRLLTAFAYQRAIAAGTLTGDDARRAREECRRILGIRDMKVIGHGEEVDLEASLVAGKTNIVDFYSVHCGPCMQLAPYLEELVDSRTDLYLVKVDIDRPGAQGIDWQSPTARQFQLESIPHLRIYGPDGKLQAEGDDARERIIQMIQESGAE